MKKNSYYELKKKHQQEVNNFPMAFAFSNKQFEAGMRKLGLEPTDTDKVFFLGGTGGFYRKSDAEALHEMFERHDKEMKEAINADTTGDSFICDMFSYELANHEYGYTYELDDTLDALGLTMDEINSKENLKHGLKLALSKY